MSLTITIPLSVFLAIPPQSAGTLFQTLDGNMDGQIESNEVAESQQTWFQRALRVSDHDNNGLLTAQELEDALREPERRVLPGVKLAARVRQMDPGKLDRNNDGEITLDEVPEPLKEKFQQVLERINKESIDVESARQYFGEQAKNKKEEKGPQATGKQQKKPETSPAAAAESKKRPAKNGKKPPAGDKVDSGFQARFERLDRNKDGIISETEVPDRLQSVFKRLDRDADGTVTQDEFRTRKPAAKP